VVRQVRPKLVCKRCERIVQSETPSRPIACDLAGPGLLAHVLVAKYADHLPFYRQSEIYACEELDRSILAGWVGGVGTRMRPLDEGLAKEVFKAGKLHTGDMPVPVLALGKAKTRTGLLWVVRATIERPAAACRRWRYFVSLPAARSDGRADAP
jgi:hypothetical protein